MLCDHCQKQEARCHITNICGGEAEVKNLCDECQELLASGEIKAIIARQREKIQKTPCKFCGVVVGDNPGFLSGGGVPGEEEYEAWCARCGMLQHEFMSQPENRLPDFPENDEDETAINEWLNKSQKLNKAAEARIKNELAKRRANQ